MCVACGVLACQRMIDSVGDSFVPWVALPTGNRSSTGVQRHRFAFTVTSGPVFLGWWLKAGPRQHRSLGVMRRVQDGGCGAEVMADGFSAPRFRERNCESLYLEKGWRPVARHVAVTFGCVATGRIAWEPIWGFTVWVQRGTCGLDVFLMSDLSGLCWEGSQGSIGSRSRATENSILF